MYGPYSPVNSIWALGDKMLGWLFVQVSQGLQGLLSVIRQMLFGTALSKASITFEAVHICRQQDAAQVALHSTAAATHKISSFLTISDLLWTAAAARTVHHAPAWTVGWAMYGRDTGLLRYQ